MRTYRDGVVLTSIDDAEMESDDEADRRRRKDKWRAKEKGGDVLERFVEKDRGKKKKGKGLKARGRGDEEEDFRDQEYLGASALVDINAHLLIVVTVLMSF